MELDAQALLKKDLPARIKHGWLKMNFGSVALTEGRRGITARLPRAYHAVGNPLDDLLAAMFQAEAPSYLIPVQLTAPTAAGAISRLYAHVARFGCMEYLPKDGQVEEQVIERNRPYFSVHFHERQHSHSNAPDLIDFGYNQVYGGVLVRKTGLNSGRHCHYIPAELKL